MSIYADVQAAQELIDNCFDPETGEVYEDQEQQAEELKAEVLEQGMETLCKVRVNYLAEVDGLKAEEKRLADKRKRTEKKIENLERYIYDIHKLGGLDKTKAGSFTISLRKSEVVELEDGFENKEYGRYEFKADKTLIKKQIKLGDEIPGARLVQRENLQIK